MFRFKRRYKLFGKIAIHLHERGFAVDIDKWEINGCLLSQADNTTGAGGEKQYRIKRIHGYFCMLLVVIDECFFKYLTI